MLPGEQGGRRAAERGTSAGLAPATPETHSVTFIHTTSIMPQNHLKTLLCFTGVSSNLPLHPKHRKTQQTIKFHYTVLIFYVFPPVQIKHHVGGLKSNKTYLPQYGSLKYKHRRKSKTTLHQKTINMPTEETSVQQSLIQWLI